jgi:hypothetical protein
VASFDEGLRALMKHGWCFQHLCDDAGNVVVLIGSYGWAGYYDRLHVHGQTEAMAARALMDPRPGIDEVVWQYQGDAVTAIQELLALPKPHEAGAPRLARRASVGWWLSGTGLTLPGAVEPPP